ncbi:hypothetical protein H7F15_05845 [Pontibacter sp. Tf4]|uniref:hypothetical protein n=1 Tax=Pontibacter sp. Tf4 TaxID=2761620 RepID=UPI001629F6D4|nr:hypothetical protein [Pontibacter sp. Tf4]MBB6610551.1 hypothetical protein [Pontibacter sp. Tf4]
MLLFENSLIKLNYDPATDILCVDYPDLHGYIVDEVNYSIDIMVDNVIAYDVKYLLLDSRRTVISVSAEESRKISVYLASKLAMTRLQKLARIQAPNPDLEKRAEGTIKDITTTIPLPYLLRTFPTMEEAMYWLVLK